MHKTDKTLKFQLFPLAPHFCWPGLGSAVAVLLHRVWSFPRLQGALPFASLCGPFAATTAEPCWLARLEVLGVLNFGKKFVHFLSRLPVYFFLKQKESTHELSKMPSFVGRAHCQSERLPSFSDIYLKETSIRHDIWQMEFNHVRLIAS